MVKPVSSSDLLKGIVSTLSAAAQRADEAKAPQPSSVVEPTAHPRRILLVEDNAVNRQVAITVLQRRGHNVTVAVTGKEALGRLEKDTFDMVLMDLQMPEMGGLEATAVIRAREETTGEHMPIFAMTAHAMKGDRERCLEAGMDGCISKPINRRELLALVERTDLLRPDESLAAAERPSAA